MVPGAVSLCRSLSTAAASTASCTLGGTGTGRAAGGRCGTQAGRVAPAPGAARAGGARGHHVVGRLPLPPPPPLGCSARLRTQSSKHSHADQGPPSDGAGVWWSRGGTNRPAPHSAAPHSTAQHGSTRLHLTNVLPLPPHIPDPRTRRSRGCFAGFLRTKSLSHQRPSPTPEPRTAPLRSGRVGRRESAPHLVPGPRPQRHNSG